MCQVVVYEESETGEFLGEVILPDGRYLSRVLIQAGWAWWNEPEGLMKVLAVKEKDARKRKLGMWVRPGAKPPWVENKKTEGKKTDEKD